MIFWPFLNVKPQAYSTTGAEYTHQYVGGRLVSSLRGLDYSAWIDNQEDWVAFSEPASVSGVGIPYSGNYAIKSDGTLWSVGGTPTDSLFLSQWWIFQYAGPYQVGSDSDWASFAGSYILKKDGSLWSFAPRGRGTDNLSEGGARRDYSSGTYGYDNGFRAIISSPIRAIELFRGYQPKFARKPTVSVESRKRTVNFNTFTPAPMPGGSGAEFFVDWKGQIRDIRLLSGGSGYTSAPTVTAVPQGDDVDGGVKLWAVMTPTATAGFRVETRGSGYTYATATDPITGGTADAVIEDGEIVSWSLTSPGAAERRISTSPYSPITQSTAAAIAGDGSGATASCVAAACSVADIRAGNSTQSTRMTYADADNPPCWSQVPSISITGGGGSGAAAAVDNLWGEIKSVEVINGGSGYSGGSLYPLIAVATPSADDAISQKQDVGDVKLSGGSVVRIEGPQSPVFLGGQKASTGVVKPFSVVIAYWTAESYQQRPETFPFKAELVGSSGLTVDLSVSQEDYTEGGKQWHRTVASLAAEAGGFGAVEPKIRYYFKGDRTGDWSNSATEATYVRPVELCYPSTQYATVATVGINNKPYSYNIKPAGAKSIKAEGARGAKLELFNINGDWRQKSRKNVVIRTFSSSDQYTQTPIEPTPISPEIEFSDEPFRYFELFLPANFSPMRTDFISERTEEYAEVFCVDGRSPESGVESLARGRANLASGDGGLWGYQSVSLSSGGVGYVEEPLVLFGVQSRFIPERIGSDAWDSLGSNDVGVYLQNPGQYAVVRLGVTKTGKAYLLPSLANSGNERIPVGRGVKISVSTEQTDWIDTNRIVIDRPDSAFGAPPSLASGYFSIYGAIVGGEDGLVVTLESKNFPANGKDDRKYKTFAFNQRSFGSGYTRVPSVRFLELDPDNPIYDIRAELIGPESFSRVTGSLLIDSDGTAWDPFSQEPAGYAKKTAITRTRRVSRFTVRQDVEYKPEWLDFYFFLLYGNSDISTKLEDFESQETKTHRIAIFRTGTANASQASCSLSMPPGLGALTEGPGSGTSHVQDDEIECPEGKRISPLSIKGWRTTIQTEIFNRSTRPSFSSAFSVRSLADGRLARVFTIPYLGYLFDDSFSQPSISTDGDASFEICENVESPFRRVPRVIENRGQIVWLDDGSVGYYIGGVVFVDPVLAGLALPRNASAGTGRIGRRLYRLPRFSVDNYGVWSPVDGSNRLRRKVDLEVKLDSSGAGYTEPPVVSIDQPPGTAVVKTQINGKARGAAIVRPGSGFHSPPALTVTANDNTGGGASLTAVIQGPIHDVSVSSGGAGYRCPPEVLFSTNGVPAVASASCSGSVLSVTVADGGSGFRSAPEISFSGSGRGAAATAEIAGEVQYVTVTDGGHDYTAEPSISLSGGGGSGAAAVAVLAGDGRGKYKVARVLITSGGSGYSEPPSVSFSGGGGSGAVADATLNASIVSVSVTNGGVGYGTGTAAIAGNARLGVALSMSVDSVEIEYGGRYRRQPSVSFQPLGHVGSISLTSGGSGYSSTPLVGIAAPCGRGAKAECRISASLAGVAVQSGGQGYSNPPLVEVVGGYSPASGRQAKAHAVVSGGAVTAIIVDDPGDGYYERPTISFARYAEAILKCTAKNGSIVSVEVVSGGYGYAASPSLSFPGGRGASATATVANGRIASVVVTAGGEGYQEGARCLISSGIGTGAVAAATISGEVVSVSVTDCGYGFEPDEPVAVFFSGGGGDGAAATATVSTSGSGAAATARINGSVVAVKIDSQGGGYQTSPSVSVDMSNNFLAEDPTDPSFLPYIQVRVAGKVSRASVVAPGANYGGRDDRFNVFTKPAWASATSGPLGGGITSASISQAGLTGDYSYPPSMNFENTITANCEVSCLHGAFSVDVGEDGSGPPRSSATYHLGLNAGPPDPSRPSSISVTYYDIGDDSHGISMLGKIQSGSFTFLRLSRGQYIVTFPEYAQASRPTVIVVDSNGTGGEAKMQQSGNVLVDSIPILIANSLLVTSQGEGYTLDATVYMRGGRPSSWDSPPRGAVEINHSTGRLTGAVSWESRGDGNFVYEDGAIADVYLDGGGELEGSISQIGTLIFGPPPYFFNLALNNSSQKRKFASTPRMIVVTREKPAHRQRTNVVETTNELLANNFSLVITNAFPESVSSKQTTSTTISSPESGPSSDPYRRIGFGDDWAFYRHYWEGEVSFVWIGYPEQARANELSSAPTLSFSLGGEGTGASAHSEIVGWTEFFSDTRAVRAT